MKTAIYPLSADPIHNGHVNNIKQLLKLEMFEHIYVAIGKNYEKKTKYLFSDQEKLIVTRQALKSLGGKVSVELFDGLLVHYAEKKNTNIIIRGLRNNMDFEQEHIMAEFNRGYDLQTFMMPAPKDTFTVSSTTIKAIVANGGLVHEYVPVYVKQALEEKLQKLVLVGVTGNTGSGKSTLCKELEKVDNQIKTIDVDELIKDIYKKNKAVQETVKKEFKTLDRGKLGNIIFNDSAKRMRLAQILQTPFKIGLENKIKDLAGIVLLDCAYIMEYDLLATVNNNVILLTCKMSTKLDRNKRAEEVIKVQHPDVRLKKEIKNQQKAAGYGNYIEINTDRTINYREIARHLHSWSILN